MSDDVDTPAAVDLEARMARLLDRTLGYLLAALVFVIMILTFVDVVGRQAFNYPVPAGFEITELLMGYTVYLGLPLVCARQEHITINVLDHLYKGAARRIQGVALNSLFGVLSLIWTREVWIHADKLAGHNEILMFLKIPVAPFVYGMCVFTLLAAAVFFVLAWGRARQALPMPQADGG